MTGLGEDWGVSLPDWDFSPYRNTLAEGTLIAAPVQLAGERWEDCAISDTMYTAWNNPDRMEEMLSEQQAFTVSDLAAAQPKEGQTEQNGAENSGEEDARG